VGSSAFDPSTAPGWVEAGAAYVGGCCQVGPEQISAMAATLNTT
jgi:homocysteine S-methyltransferase